MARPLQKTDERGKYRQEFATQAAKLCALGATNDQLADFFEVDVRTIYRWKAEFEEFCQALKIAKDEADERIERSLYERAAGYERDEVDIRVVSGEGISTPARLATSAMSWAASIWPSKPLMSGGACTR